jgi:predicted enzyme related to lactoylglutathione lyase
MERVTGIGGVFLKAKNPQLLADWYETHLGITFAGNTYSVLLWQEELKLESHPSSVFAFFPNNTTYFAPSNSPFMLNFRVHNLDAMLEQLKNAGVKIMPESHEDDNGRFAWILDPEENKIELWQPAAGH